MKNWFKNLSMYAKLLLLLGVSTFIFFAIDIFTCLDYKAYLPNIVTTLLGTIVTAVYIQKMLDKRSDNDEKRSEQMSISRAKRTFELYKKKYIIYLNMLIDDGANPNSDWDLLPHDAELKISRLSKAHEEPLLATESRDGSRIESFYSVEVELRECIVNMIANISFKYYSRISDLLLRFVEVSIGYNARNGILNNGIIQYGSNMTIAQYVTNELANHGDDYLEQFSSGVRKVDIITPYILLFLMIQQEVNIIRDLQIIFDSVEFDNSL